MTEKILRILSEISQEEQMFLEGASDIDRDRYMTSEANIINAQKLMDSGKLIEMRTHTRFVHFPEHTHDYIELVYMCSGKTIHMINGEKITLSKGDILILNQHATQEILPAEAGDIAINFIIMPSFFSKVLETLGDEQTPLRTFIMDCILGKESTNGYLLFKVAEVAQIQNLFENLIISFIEKAPARRKMRELTLCLIFLELTNQSNLLSSSNIERNVLLEILSYIDENYRECSLADIAARFHYNANGISRMIKEKTGLTFIELLQRRRLLQTEYLLKNTKMHIDAIAHSVGYSNTNYFHKLFQKHHGISPRQYREQWKKR